MNTNTDTNKKFTCKSGIYTEYFKRPLDFICALAALIALSPLLLALSVIGAFAMKGSPFFFQRRPGKINPKTGKEKLFKLVKFKTMTDEKDQNGNLLPDSKRLNKYGRFLRSTSLDELPSLINIIEGSLSVVGPRPLLVSYLPLYNKRQRYRHCVRPGLTGLAQVSGRNNLSWEEKFDFDIRYAERITFFGDLKIIFLTVIKVLTREGISQKGQATMEAFTGSANSKETTKNSVGILNNGGCFL